jgi:hypothetical protein
MPSLLHIWNMSSEHSTVIQACATAVSFPLLAGTLISHLLSAGLTDIYVPSQKKWRPRQDSNLCLRRERAVSWAGLDDGDVPKMTA